jgi:two-component system sensor histidine kinase and response regulator WspE
VRRAAGKRAEGVIQVEARHSAGALQIIVSDDGRGVDLEKLAKPWSRGTSRRESLPRVE